MKSEIITEKLISKNTYLTYCENMTNMTLAIPEELHAIIKRRREVKWSEVARQALWEHANKVEMMDKILAKSKLTQADVDDISKKIKRGIARGHGIHK